MSVTSPTTAHSPWNTTLNQALARAAMAERRAAAAEAAAAAAEIRATEAEARASLAVAEIRHRTLNDLQRVNATFVSDAAKAEPDVRDALKTAATRIMAIASVHALLLNADADGTIEAHTLLNRLARGLEGTLSGTRQVAITVQADPVTLPSRTATSIAQLAGELATNAVKYAFPGNKAGQIALRLSRHDHTFVLEVTDNGIGMPEGAESRTRTDGGGLGTRICRALAAELGAALMRAKSNGNGTTWRVVCPLPPHLR